MLSFSSYLHLPASVLLFTPFLKKVTCDLLQITVLFHFHHIPVVWITVIVGIFIWCIVNGIFKWYEVSNYVFERVWKETTLTCFMVCSRIFSGRTEETHHKSHVWRSCLRLTYELSISCTCMTVGVNK